MATIKPKRGSGYPTGLAENELAVDTVNGAVYVGSAGGTGITVAALDAYTVRTQTSSSNTAFPIGFVTSSITQNAILRDLSFTYNPSTDTIGLPGFTLNHSGSGIITSASNISGGEKNLTVKPFGTVIIAPQTASVITGSLPTLSVSNSSALVSITGGDLYLGRKDIGVEDQVTAAIIFEGDTDDGFETTISVVDPTADRTIQFPNDSGTVALTKNLVSSFNGSTGAVQGVSSVNGSTGAITNVARTNEGNTFTVLQVMNAGITTANLFVSSGATFVGNISAPNIVYSVNGRTGDVTGLSASTVMLGSTNSNATRYLVFAATAGEQSLLVDNITTPLSYNPNTGTVGAKIFDATSGSNQVKLDAAVGTIFVSDGTDTSLALQYGFEHSGPTPHYFYNTGTSPSTFIVTPALRVSDGDDDVIYGPSTWGYTFPSANGTSGQAMFTDGGGQLYWGTVTSGSASGVSSINGATGAITNVAKTNEGNTFSVRQVMNAGITTSNLFVTSGSTFTSKIESTSTSDNIDIVATTDGSGLRIAQATSGAASRIGAIRLGRAPTTAFNTFLENSSGIFTIYNGINNTGTKLFDIDTTSAEFFVPIVGPTFNSAPTSDGGYRITSNAINALTGTTYALLAADNGKVITWSNASGVTLTVPSGLPVGFNTTVIQIGAGAVGITGSGTTLNSFEGKLRTAGQHSAVSIISYSSNVFNIAGGLTG